MNWIDKIDSFFNRESILYVFLFGLITLYLIILSFSEPDMRITYLCLAAIGLHRTWRHLVLWNEERKIE